MKKSLVTTNFLPTIRKMYILMHRVACIKLMPLFRIEFEIGVMNCSFACIMVCNLEFIFHKIFNQSEDKNRRGRKRKYECQSQ